MKLTISKEANPNYLAKIVEVTNFGKHPNADKLKLATVDGCVTAVGINSQPGVYIYFPVECCISQKYLHENNLYRVNTINANIEATPGFFEETGRVKCIKLRGFASEGLLMPIETLTKESVGELKSMIGVEFDTVNDELLVKKYTIPQKNRGMSGGTGKKSKAYEELIVDNQFRFHPDTEQLKKHLFKFQPETQIQISHKFHGTSAIFCNLLVKKKLSLWQRILKALGNNIVETEYKTFCSSRKVVKDPELNKNLTQGYYKCDIWNLGLEIMKPHLQKGMTIYAEIVGYMPDGGMIQKDYDYGCMYLPQQYEYAKMTPLAMYEAKLFKIYIYRITYTNVDGKVFEMPANILQQYCRSRGLTSVIEDFYGTTSGFINFHGQLYLDDLSEDTFEEFFLKCLINEYLEGDCKWCKNKVPAEGVVVRIDQPEFEAYKLKSLAFLTHESKILDEGIADIESEESGDN